MVGTLGQLDAKAIYELIVQAIWRGEFETAGKDESNAITHPEVFGGSQLMSTGRWRTVLRDEDGEEIPLIDTPLKRAATVQPWRKAAYEGRTEGMVFRES